MPKPTAPLFAVLLLLLAPRGAAAEPCCTLDAAESYDVRVQSADFGPDGGLYLVFRDFSTSDPTTIERWAWDEETGELTPTAQIFDTGDLNTFRQIQVFADHVYLDSTRFAERDPTTGALSNMGFSGAAGRGFNLSSDGAHAYAGGGGTGFSELRTYDRGADGLLTEIGAVDIAAIPDLMDDFTAAGIGGESPGVVDAAITPDGLHVYALAGHQPADRFNNDNPNLSSVVGYSRNPATGALTYVDHWFTVDDPLDDLAAATRLVMHPSGDYLLATVKNDGLRVWSRNPATGVLTETDFLEDFHDAPTVFAPNGRHLIVVESGFPLEVWELNGATGELDLVELQRAGIGGVPSIPVANTLLFSPDELHFYVLGGGSGDGVQHFRYFEAIEEVESLAFVQALAVSGAGSGDDDTPSGLAESADGLFLYASLGEANDVAIFARDPDTGELSDLGRVAGDFAGSLLAPGPLALSPDGSHLYALGTDGLSRLDRAGDGSLTYGATTAVAGEALAMSSDGSELFVSDSEGDTLQVFERNAGDGSLTPAETFTDGAAGVTGLERPLDVTLSPDQKFVYVITNVGFGESALARFERDAGVVSFAGAQTTSEVTGTAGRFVRIPAGGQHLYVLDNFIIGGKAYIYGHARDATDGSVMQLGQQLGGVARFEGVDGPSATAMGGTAFSPSGNYLYVSGDFADSLVSLRRNASTGRLRFVEALYDGEGGVDGLGTPGAVHASTDGRHVYAVGRAAGEIAVFERVAGAGATVRGFALPKKVAVTRSGDLTVSGLFDLGPDPVDLSGPLTLRVGDAEIALPGLAPNRARTTWRYKDDTVNLTLAGLKPTSSRAKLKLKVSGDFTPWADGAMPLDISLAGGGLDAGCEVELADGAFKLGKSGTLLHPVLALEKLGAKAPIPEKARVKAKLRVATLPELPFDVTVGLGDAYSEEIPADAFVQKGSKLQYKSKAGPVTLLRIDLAKGQVTVDARGADLAPLAQDEDASLGLALGSESSLVRFSLGGKPGARKY